MLTGQLELQAEEFLFGSLLETTRELGGEAGGQRANHGEHLPLAAEARRVDRRNRRKNKAPLENTVSRGAREEGVPGSGLHWQPRKREQEPGEATAFTLPPCLGAP